VWEGEGKRAKVRAAHSQVVGIAPLLGRREARGKGLPRHCKEKGVHGKVVQNRREGASLFEAVFHLDSDVVGSDEDGSGKDIAEKGDQDVGGPGWEADQTKEGEKVVSGNAVICTFEVMEEEVIWFFRLEPRVEIVINLLNVLLDALTPNKGALRLLEQLSQTGGDRGSKDVRNDPVVRIGH
jgi:hypothetical protein